MREAGRTVPGLRERNKARTRAEIRRQAFRLFTEQGYAATTVDQIAAAAEVSPSTFFRYFPTKEDVVLYDDLDPLIIASFRAQPAELTPLQATRAAFRDSLTRLASDELADEEERQRLIQAVPELRARSVDALVQAVRLLAGLVAERIGRPADDLEVLAFAGAVTGLGMATMFDPERNLEQRWRRMDEALGMLEAGLPL
ncbi:TetR family transcriptional regulator [Plantactinospora siamensis]|uniref:TetR family transcriptional regulator n=1 Tax=Plantactinospora siamensis TaxID=555372 RepID=A0ABV6P023_9ACTN